MTARIGNYVGLVPATASLAFPSVGNSALHDGFPFVGNSICSSDELFSVRKQIYSSGEMLSVGNFTRDSDQILQYHDLAENDPSPSQSEIALVLHEIAKTRECMNAVFDHLDDLCDRLGAFCEKREKDHRVNRDVAISKSTSPAYSFMESMESDYRPQRVSDQHVWQRTLCFHNKARGQCPCECPNLSAPSRADMDLKWRQSMKTRNRHDYVNDKHFGDIAKDVYDNTLLLEGSTCSYKQDTFLDLYIRVVDHKFITGIYHKVDDFNFEVISYPFPQCNVHSMLGYSTYYSQLIRFFRLCNNINDFLFRAKFSYSKLVKRGYKHNLLLKYFKKFCSAYNIEGKYGEKNSDLLFSVCLNTTLLFLVI